jgi:hypothetical protein
MFWQKIRSGVMFVISAITCPCHVPLVLPIVLASLAGTPAAVWVMQNVGWIYGGMTILFVVSLAWGLRWMGQSEVVCEPNPTYGTERHAPEMEGTL